MDQTGAMRRRGSEGFDAKDGFEPTLTIINFGYLLLTDT
jgi:hypothetical protein